VGASLLSLCDVMALSAANSWSQVSGYSPVAYLPVAITIELTSATRAERRRNDCIQQQGLNGQHSGFNFRSFWAYCSSAMIIFSSKTSWSFSCKTGEMTSGCFFFPLLYSMPFFRDQGRVPVSFSSFPWTPQTSIHHMARCRIGLGRWDRGCE
jgi:hypothetical protein